MNFYSENALLKEQKKKDELKECTFKPNIDTNFIPRRKDRNDIIDIGNRYENLYNLGKALIKNKKDKTKIDIENDELKLCSFKPDITK